MKPLQLLVTGIVLLLNAHGLFGQTSNMQKMRKDKNGNVAFAEFAPESTQKRLAEGESFLTQVLKAQDEARFQLVRSKTDKYGYTHKKYQQYYRGVKVEGAEYALHGKEEYVSRMNGKYVNVQISSTSPSISESNALDYALKAIGANKYSWEDEGMEQFIKERKKM